MSIITHSGHTKCMLQLCRAQKLPFPAVIDEHEPSIHMIGSSFHQQQSGPGLHRHVTKGLKLADEMAPQAQEAPIPQSAREGPQASTQAMTGTAGPSHNTIHCEKLKLSFQKHVTKTCLKSNQQYLVKACLDSTRLPISHPSNANLQGLHSGCLPYLTLVGLVCWSLCWLGGSGCELLCSATCERAHGIPRCGRQPLRSLRLLPLASSRNHPPCNIA